MRPDVRIVLVIAYTGADPLGADIARMMTQYLETQNNVGDTEVFSFERFDLGRLYSQLSGAAGRNIKLQIAITEWATVSSPFRAYYGQVNLADVASWAEYGKALLYKNLRFYRGATDVNDAIEESLRRTPDLFWYLNNGITILCSSITKLPIHGESRDFGVFECHGVSVVNGAQTLGVVWEAAKKTPDIGKSLAKVHVRLLSLENCPEGFDRTVTTATNTQNRIEQRDFAALDGLQQRLAREMALDGRRYAFKTGDPDPRNGEGCSIEEAAVALACAEDDTNLAVDAEAGLAIKAREITQGVFVDTCQAVQTKYANAYPANLFKNHQRCKDLLDKNAPVLGPIGPLFDWMQPA